MDQELLQAGADWPSGIPGENSEVSSEMCSYGLRKTTIRKDIHLIHKRLKMGFYTAEVFSAVRIEDEDS